MKPGVPRFALTGMSRMRHNALPAGSLPVGPFRAPDGEAVRAIVAQSRPADHGFAVASGRDET